MHSRNQSSPQLPQDHRAQSEFAAKLVALRDPATYPFPVSNIDIVETHFAWLFLAGDVVYKLKKPVRVERLDNSTLSARHLNCSEELRLNRRLAANVYLAIVPLALQADRTFRLEADGVTVEWLVKMRRLPHDLLLDHAIDRGNIPHHGLAAAARLLANFYAQQQPIGMSAEDYATHFAKAIADNHCALLAGDLKLDPLKIERLIDMQQHFFECHVALFAGRAQRAIDGHGDLRPEHVYIGMPAAVIDCVEFDRELRLLDPAEELASLQVECDRLNHPQIGRTFLTHYVARTGDSPAAALFAFYMSHRATTRAKLAAWHLRDPAVNNHEHWRAKAMSYLQQALGYLSHTCHSA